MALPLGSIEIAPATSTGSCFRLGSPRLGNYGIDTSIFQSAHVAAAALSAICGYAAGPAGAQMGEQLSTFNGATDRGSDGVRAVPLRRRCRCWFLGSRRSDVWSSFAGHSALADRGTAESQPYGKCASRPIRFNEFSGPQYAVSASDGAQVAHISNKVTLERWISCRLRGRVDLSSIPTISAPLGPWDSVQLRH
jgi:hypothetical protein